MRGLNIQHAMKKDDYRARVSSRFQYLFMIFLFRMLWKWNTIVGINPILPPPPLKMSERSEKVGSSTSLRCLYSFHNTSSFYIYMQRCQKVFFLRHFFFFTY